MTTLVFLHGWATDRRIWHRQQLTLDTGAQVLAPDLPSWDAAWLADYLRPLSLPDTIVVGSSLGGMLAVEAIARFLSFPQALVLVGVAACFCNRDGFSAGVPSAVVRAMRRRLRSEPENVVREFTARCLAPGEEEYRAELASLIPPVNPQFLASGLDYLLDRDLRPWLSRLTGPVTIVHGGQDRITPVAQAHFLKAQIPAARLLIFAPAGHLPFLTQAAEFHSVLVEVLDEHRKGPLRP